MGAGISFEGLPERADFETCQIIASNMGLKTHLDRVRFDLMKGSDGKITRIQAIQLAENKQPPIFSVNPMSSKPSA